MKKLSFKTTNLLLTGFTASCIIGTAVSAAKGGQEASERLKLLEKSHITDMVDLEGPSTFEKIKTVAPCYGWSALFMTGALIGLFGSHRYNSQVNSALFSAYTLIDKAYADYRQKNVELHGKECDDEIMMKLAEIEYQHVMSFGKEEDIIIFDGDELYYDEFSGRWFKSTKQEIDMAEQFINEVFNTSGYCELSVYYDQLGLNEVEYGNLLGWSQHMGHSTYGYTWIHIKYEDKVSECGIPYTSISFPFRPTIDFFY